METSNSKAGAGEGAGAVRWGVLFAFAFSAASNSFMFMDFSTTAALSEHVLECDSYSLEWLYSASLLTVMPLSLPAAFLLVRYNWATSFAGVLMNVLGAWLRYFAISQADYVLALLSSLLIGGAAAIVIVSYTMIAEVWFPANERVLATSLGVQANYLGWALGSLIPLFVQDADTQRSFFLGQALVISLALVFFFTFYKRQANPAVHESLTWADAVDQIKLLGGRGVYWVHAVCYAVLGGVSFTVPAVLDIIVGSSCDLPGLGLGTDQTLWLNFCFVASGIVAGIVLGACAQEKHAPAVLRSLFCSATVCLSLLSLTAFAAPSIGEAALYPLLLLLMSLSGVASLGFVGLGLRAAVKVAGPVSEVYSGGMVEFLLQGAAVVLTQFTSCSTGFALLAGSTAAAAAALLCTPFHAATTRPHK